eukprot:SAG31_NODE_268_length_18767_cov_4.644900_6_plen_269_part_00
MSSAQRKEMQRENLPWIEKYRPRNVDEIAHQDEVVRMLKRSLETGNLPHLLFYGPPGTGKTSTVLAIAKQLYGPQLCRKRVLELNASDERGINVVRTKVKDFASSAVSQQVAGYPCPPYKIIVLDEADAMTHDAQTALRRTMEAFAKVTRFCIICNYVSRIIQPLSSRCAKFRFKPLGSGQMIARLQHIAGEEGIDCPDSVMETVVKCSGGDMRKAITFLQSAHQYGGGEMTSGGVLQLASLVPDGVVDGLIAACRSKSFDAMQVRVT